MAHKAVKDRRWICRIIGVRRCNAHTATIDENRVVTVNYLLVCHLLQSRWAKPRTQQDLRYGDMIICAGLDHLGEGAISEVGAAYVQRRLLNVSVPRAITAAGCARCRRSLSPARLWTTPTSTQSSLSKAGSGYSLGADVC